MDAQITPAALRGRVRAPPSKSYTHRAILAAGYGDGATVRSPLASADTRATARAVDLFGGAVSGLGDGSSGSEPPDRIEIEGFRGRPATPADVIDCANSGTTMRLVTATAALADGTTVLTGDASLRSRPQGPLLDALGALGARAESTRGNGRAPLIVGGPIDGGRVSLPGDVSSQYVSALLMAGGATDDGIEIDLTTELKSAPYVDITLELLEAFGIDAEPLGSDRAAGADGFRVTGGAYAPAGDAYDVPGDFSSISYLAAAGAVAADPDADLLIEGAVPSAQGDTAIVDVLDRMGATVDWRRGEAVLAVGRSALSSVTVDVGDTPDLLPTIAALGAVADGTTRITNCEHVRYKETDRVSAVAEELGRLGAATVEEPDALTVHGGESTLAGATVDGRGDHRIVMALAVAALAADGTTTIRGAEHVDVSFPGFFGTLAGIGAGVELVE